jgi:hypothetical protein
MEPAAPPPPEPAMNRARVEASFWLRGMAFCCWSRPLPPPSEAEGGLFGSPGQGGEDGGGEGERLEGHGGMHGATAKHELTHPDQS